jgi:hypothetical protein
MNEPISPAPTATGTNCAGKCETKPAANAPAQPQLAAATPAAVPGGTKFTKRPMRKRQ